MSEGVAQSTSAAALSARRLARAQQRGSELSSRPKLPALSENAIPASLSSRREAAAKPANDEDLASSVTFNFLRASEVLSSPTITKLPRCQDIPKTWQSRQRIELRYAIQRRYAEKYMAVSHRSVVHLPAACELIRFPLLHMQDLSTAPTHAVRPVVRPQMGDPR